MSSITCPRCGALIPVRRSLTLANKPFCTRCGWNLDRAETALAAKSAVAKLLPLGMAAVGLFAAFAALQAKAPLIFILPALFGLIALTPIWSYYAVRKAMVAARATVNPDLAVAQLALDPSLQMLQSLPRPRQVRFRFQGSSAAVVAVFGAAAILNGVLFFLISRGPLSGRDLGLTPFIPLLFVLPVFGVVMLVPYFREKRNLPLLRDGELAFARVVSQQTIQQGKASYSRIDYEFKTNTGQLIRNSCRDLTGTVFEDMTVPVFYDSLDASKNLASCATYLKVVNSFQ